MVPWNKVKTPLAPRICEFCQSPFEKPKSCSMKNWWTTRFCSIKCFRAAANQKKADERAAEGWVKTCGLCGIEYQRKSYHSFAQWNRRNYCSRKCVNVGRRANEEKIKKLHDSLRGQTAGVFLPGKKHPNWKGGKSSLALRIRRMKEYRHWYALVRYRDNGICRKCGAKEKPIDVDHIKPFLLILKENNIHSLKEAKECKELWDTTNGQVLCTTCHAEKTKLEKS